MWHLTALGVSTPTMVEFKLPTKLLANTLKTQQLAVLTFSSIPLFMTCSLIDTSINIS